MNCTDRLQGIEIHTRGENLETPLHLAAGEGNLELILCLLAAGADLDIQDNAGNTARHLASFKPSDTSEMVSILLANWAHPNVRNRAGETPLRRAMTFELAAVVQALLEGGADPGLLDYSSE